MRQAFCYSALHLQNLSNSEAFVETSFAASLGANRQQQPLAGSTFSPSKQGYTREQSLHRRFESAGLGALAAENFSVGARQNDTNKSGANLPCRRLSMYLAPTPMPGPAQRAGTPLAQALLAVIGTKWGQSIPPCGSLRAVIFFLNRPRSSIYAFTLLRNLTSSASTATRPQPAQRRQQARHSSSQTRALGPPRRGLRHYLGTGGGALTIGS